MFGFVCATTYKIVWVRYVLEVRESDQGNTEISICNTPFSFCTCYHLIFQLRCGYLKGDEPCIVLDLINKLD